MTEEDEIRDKIANVIRKDGEGKSHLGKTFFEETGKRLWEPSPESFKKSSYTTRKCPDIYHMETTEGQVDAYYFGGEVVVAHNGSERARVGNMIRDYQKECKIKKKIPK